MFWMFVWDFSLKLGMDLLQNYADEKEGDLDEPANQNYGSLNSSALESPDSSPPRLLPSKSAAPNVDDTTLALTVAQARQTQSRPIDPSQHFIAYNPTYEQLWAPIYGPAHPYAKDGIAQGMRNHKLGFVEDASIDSFVFDEQYNTFYKYGYAADPAGNNYVGDFEALEKNNGVSVYNIRQNEQKKRKLEKKQEAEEVDGTAVDVDPAEFNNPATDTWLMKNRKSPWAGKKEGVQTELSEEQKKYAEEYAKKKEEKGNAGGEKGEHVEDKSTFHGKCMRTYMGHSKAVRDISFCNDGTKFLTASYDKNIKYWDTETGQVIRTFSTGKIPYVVKLNPDDDKQNILLAGMSDKKIVQWDMNTKEITQEYDQHLGAVNTITFVDSNRRFVTSSDDKSLRVWEFGIPVVIKYISEPHMHSMPSISLHPNTNWLAAQSLDNQILIYSTRERFQLNKKKRFAGHIVAGYACQVNFSPDGRFVMSGDGEGKCWFWDWKSCKVFRTLKCHEGVCIGCEWHPLEQSKVATCGWDGLIKYWD
ncbi:hypothetical protein CISIN_1g007411mg [Citrus sinensis]|uniref:Pre-mRNA-processing factor 17 n=1 Tax=Citrus sinensis TaxID=2711 RepID=A0A067DS34_CITSI|nr:hypothetical protein CISIN_1g007411mg [Citrus sinensis]